MLDNLDRKNDIIESFSFISDLRGWLWEVYFLCERNVPEKYNDVFKELKEILKSVAEDFNLFYVTN